MAKYVVTTASDSIDGGDGFLSLREAVALANADPDADIITFDISDFAISQVYIDDSAIQIAENTVLTIDGDINDDGISDIVLSAGLNHHLTIDVGAEVTLTGLDLVRGGEPAPTNVPPADGGETGASGQRGYGREDIPAGPPDSQIFIYENGGLDGEDGAPGENGARGTDGEDRSVQAGAIVNFGTLHLVRVGFGGNDAIGGRGGDAGDGGNGGRGGNGGSGVEGNEILFDYAGDNPNPYQNLVTAGGDGGDAGNGGNGGAGGNGGNGGSAAGAIYNAIGATLGMTDVTFGGLLTSLWDFGEGNTAKGGRGGAPGDGGDGGSGGNGGDGGNSGYEDIQVGEHIEEVVDVAGDGGDGGDAGNGGSAGTYGKSGDAAGAILNDGTVTGQAALFENTASTTDMSTVYAAGGGGNAGSPGDSGDGGTGRDSPQGDQPDGDDGQDGGSGGGGSGRTAGSSGTTSEGILNRDGTVSVATGSALVFAHGVNLEVTEGGEVSFNIIRIGATGGDVTVTWEVQPIGVNGSSAADFEGGALPSGEVVLAAPVAFGDSAKTLSFQVAADALAEGIETFRIVLTSVSISSGDVITGTSTLNGTISDEGAVDPDPPVNENAPRITSNGGGAAANVSVAENTTAVTTVGASDDDGDTLAYKILAGGDGALFTLNPTTHALSFKSAPNFEAPADADRNNVYEVTVQVSDGSKTDTQKISVAVANVAGSSPNGTKGKDTLNGTGEEDTILGNKGKDKLFGLAGNDILDGGKHKDKMAGGQGADVFRFADKLKDKWADKILDFEAGIDTIQLDNKIFKKVGADGALKSKYFDTGKNADSKKDRILYDEKKGWLAYDQDGSKSRHDAVKVAKLDKHLDLDAGDFLVI